MKLIKKLWARIRWGLAAQANSEEYAKTGRYLGDDPEFPGTYRPELNGQGKKVKTTAVAVIVAATTVATISAGDKDKSSGITTGQTNPYGNSSVAKPTWPYGWLFENWHFTFQDFMDGMGSWISGAPVITLDPNPPASNDASGK